MDDQNVKRRKTRNRVFPENDPDLEALFSGPNNKNGQSCRTDEVKTILADDAILRASDLEKWLAMPDREKLIWALASIHSIRCKTFTGTAVNTDDMSALIKQSTDQPMREGLMDKQALVNVYPGSEKVRAFSDAREKDVWRNSLSCSNAFLVPRDVDSSFCPQWIVPSGDERIMEKKGIGPTVPPNALFFDLIMEAYLGWVFKDSRRGMDGSVKEDNPEDSAVMGGAVVAVLDAWNDNHVREIFEEYSIIRDMTSDKLSVEDYLIKRRCLVKRLNDAFVFGLATDNDKLEDIYQMPGLSKYIIYHVDEERVKCRQHPSDYSAGDVDVFVQPSLVTVLLDRCLGPQLLNEHIGAMYDTNMDNTTRYFQKMTHEELRSCYEFAEQGSCDYYGEWRSNNIVSITGRGISNEFVSEVEAEVGPSENCLINDGVTSVRIPTNDDEDDTGPIDLWPRNTQVIGIPPAATLLQALLDFDLSAAGAAWNGASVYVTFPCLYTLTTRAMMVTPVVYREEACRRRVKKYQRRKFKGFVFDPFDLTPNGIPLETSIRLRPPLLETTQGQQEADIDAETIYGLDVLSLKDKPALWGDKKGDDPHSEKLWSYQ